MTIKTIMISLCLAPAICHAQLDAAMFMTDNQRLVSQAVDNAFVMVEQTYQLEDTVSGQRFGRYGRKTFGNAQALGVRVGKAVVVAADVLVPWERDSNFTRYRQTHRPVLSTATMSVPGDTATRRQTLRTDSARAVSPSMVTVPVAAGGVKGFATCPADSAAEGWLVLAYCGDARSSRVGQKLSTAVYRKTVDFGDAGMVETRVPDVDGMLLGGVFIVPVQTGVGQLTFRLAGVLAPHGDGGWALEALSMPAPEPSAADASCELTPLDDSTGPKKKKKKN
ncbi:MAG: hypothetical protein NC406_02190 [Bacteroides sp.]|nr:hypothetical protein [Bacteroides sp.]MCM1094847.1 hypothetical protein [Terasakiella sp.]